MNYNTLINKPTINYRELIGDNSVSEVGGITEEQFNTLLSTDLSSYYTKAQIDDLFSRSYVYREKSGSIVTFDCPTSVNVDKVVSEIVAVQSGTGDPSPTNVRHISGWDEVNVVVSPTTDAEDGTTYTTALKDEQGNPMECYGGTLTNENGVQRLDNGSVKTIIDENSSILYRSSGVALVFLSTPYKTITMGGENVKCDRLKPAYYSNYDSCQNGEIATVSGATAQTGITFKISDDITSLVELKTWLASNPLTIITNLATPTTIPQDNLAIATQDGTNNLWADSGDITVKALDKIIQE